VDAGEYGKFSDASFDHRQAMIATSIKGTPQFSILYCYIHFR
jgi:hypothetical protein